MTDVSTCRVAAVLIATAVLALGMTACGTKAVVRRPALSGSASTVGAAESPSIALAALDEKLAALPEITPAPNQFVYLKVQTSPTTAPSQFWLSVDGTRDGLMKRPDLASITGGNGDIPMPGCVNGKRTVVRGETKLKATEDCVPTVAYDPTLPTDKASMASLLASVGANASKSASDTMSAEGKYIDGTLEFMYLSKAQRVALVSAASGIAGMKVQANARNSTGRTGLSLTWPDASSGSTTSIVVDSNTAQYLGTPQEDSVESTAVVSSVGATQ